MLRVLVPRAQEFGIREYLELWGSELAEHLALIHYEDLPGRTHLPSGTYILTAFDQLTAEGMRLAHHVESRIREAGPPGRVLNATGRTLRRFELLDALWRQGLNQHRAIRAVDSPAGLRYPVFVREEFRHTGAISRLLRSEAELRAALAMALLRGFRLEELLIVEFCDTADTAGDYRKYAAFTIGQRIVPQFMNRARSWMLSLGDTQWSPEMIREERAYLEENPHQDALRRIFALAGVEFGRIDYALRDGAIETWEINLNPTLARYPTLPGELHQLREGTKHAFYRQFLTAIRELDQPVPAATLPIAMGADQPPSGPLIRPEHRERWPSGLVRAARPLRPLLEPVLELAAPLILGLFARRRAAA
ncbi:MAG TPA: hypothetical protein VIP80_12045 [Gemmatimonadales bacterium]|jgi:hypothetical protein